MRRSSARRSSFVISPSKALPLSPLRRSRLLAATCLGQLAAFGAFIFGVGLVIDTLIHGNRVAGYPSLMVTMVFLGGIQLITLGIIGEYLGRMFDESKGRPLYLLNEYKPAELWKNSSPVSARLAVR